MSDETNKKPEERSTFEEWGSTLQGAAKEAFDTISDTAKNLNAKIDFNKNGQPDLNEVLEAAKKKGGEVAEKATSAAKTLKETAGAIYEEEAPKVAEAVENNKFGLGGGILALILGMTLFEMGPIGSLILGALAFAAISMFGGDKEKGALSGYNPFAKKKEAEKTESKTLEKGDDTPVKGEGKVPTANLEHQDFTLTKNGKLVDVSNNTGRLTKEGADIQVSGNYVMKGDQRVFEISHMMFKQNDGSFGKPQDIRDKNITLDVDAEGNIDLGNQKVRDELRMAYAVAQAKDPHHEVTLDQSSYFVGKPKNPEITLSKS